jgi:MFS family permease
VVLPVTLIVAADEFGVSLPTMALALSIYGVAMGVMAVPAGLLSDRIGPARVLVLYFWAMAAAGLLCALVPGYVGFLIAHGVLGAAAGLYHPPGLALISLSSSRHEMGPAMGLHGVVGNVGIAFAPLLVLALTPVWGWRGVFLVLAGSAALAGVAAAWLRGRELVLPSRPEVHEHAEGGTLARGGLMLLLAVISINGFLLDGFMPLHPVTLRTHAALIWDPLIVSAVVLGVGGIGQWVGGLMARGAAQGARYMTLLVLQALACLGAAAFLGTPGIAVLQLAAFAFINFMTQPMENRFLAAFTSSARRSSAYAIKFLVALVLGAPAGPIVATILERSGDALAYRFLGVTALVGAVLWLVFLRSTRTPAPQAG